MLSKGISKKKTHKTVEKELLNSLMENNEVQEPGLSERANTIKRPRRSRCNNTSLRGYHRDAK